jgi:hypothetical protein
MAIAQVSCPKCNTALKAALNLPPGTKVQCRKCQNKFFIPAPPRPRPARR